MVDSKARYLLVIALAAALAVSVFAAFWPVRDNEFVRFDDPIYITGNDHVKAGLTTAGIAWAFTTGEGGNWHPVTWLSHMVDVELFELEPAGHHMMNVALHALSAVILLLLLFHATGRAWTSASAAALFALHPLRVESVAWAAERKDVLSVLFGLLALWAYVRYAQRPRGLAYGLMLACFLLGLMSKAMLVTLPFVMLLLDFWPLRRIGACKSPDAIAPQSQAASRGGDGPGWRWSIAKRLLIEKVPLLIIALAFSVIAYLVQQGAGTMAWLERVPLHARIANAVVSYVRYLGKTLWPADLAVLYPHPEGWALWQLGGAAAILIVLTWLFLALRRSHPYFIVGWLWFLGTLVPVIGLVQIGAQAMADRYTYLPSIGLAIMVAWLMLSLSRFLPRLALGGLALALVVMLGIETSIQARVWRNTESLYRHALETTTDNVVMQVNFGTLLEERGRLAEARERFEIAARLRPDQALFRFKVADLLARQGRIKDAMDGFRAVLERDPDQIEAMNSLAWFLATQADPLLRDGAEALRLAERASQLAGGDDPAVLDTLAAAQAEAGRMDEAVRTAERALALAIEKKDAPLEGLIASHLELFRAGRPLREGVVAPDG